MSDSPVSSPPAPACASTDAWAPEQLLDDRFQIVRELGRGGMGAVYVGFDRELCREVALKRMLPTASGDIAHEERFRREYRALASIRHPGVPQVHHTGRAPDGSPWFTMEIVHGEPLRALLDRGRLTPLQALDLAIELGRILAAAHDVGVIHRDVKPSNIMVEVGGRVRLLDFGVCSPLPRFLRHAEPRRRTADVDRWHTQDGQFAGTFGYSDPATFDGTPATLRSDIFSVAAILYEMLTSRRLFDMDASRYHSIDSAELPPELAPLAVDLRQAASQNPFERPRSMAQFVQRLEIGRGQLLRFQAERRASRLRILLALLGVTLGLVAAVLLGSLIAGQPADLSLESSSPRAPPDATAPAAATVAPPADPGPAPAAPAAATVAPPADPGSDPAAATIAAPADLEPAPAPRDAASSEAPTSAASQTPDGRAAARGQAGRRLASRTAEVQRCADTFGAPGPRLVVHLRRGAGRITDVTLADGPWFMLRRCIAAVLSDMSFPPGDPAPARFTFHIRRETQR